MKKILVALFTIATFINAQTVYEPLHRDIYEFLSRLSQKGIIEYHDEMKPVSREYIAAKLIQADSLQRQLTPLEKDELEFFKKDFGVEINYLLPTNHYLLTIDSVSSSQKLVSSSQKIVGSQNKETITLAGRDAYGRYRLFNYEDDLFKVNVSPILGYERGSIDGKSYSHRWNGAALYGYINKNVGFSFDFRDNKETGNYDTLKKFSSVTGTNNLGFKSGIEYSEIRTHLSYTWSWGQFVIGKEFLEWGHGENGKLVISQKAPSFPFFRYKVKPVSWLSFDYLHAWLSSDIVDSNEVYETGATRGGTHRILYREKYFVSHTLTAYPVKGLSVSLGESIVYSDRFEPIYLFPMMFFRAADHYVSRQNNSAGGNSQFFLGISSRNHINNTHLYGTGFIDEIRTSEIGNASGFKNQSGFTLGGSVVDLPINNLKLTLEYTKIFPFVYMHYIPAQSYQNASYNMGHWMGSNADLVYFALHYRLFRGLNIDLWFQKIRKGEEGNPEMQHTLPQAPFLFGLRKNYDYLGAEVKYELTHELFLRGRFVYNKQEFQQQDKSFVENNFSEFYMAVYYGL